MEWEQTYAELLNKFRWSIASTVAGQGFNYSYQESLALAGVLAGDALNLIKLKHEKPDLRINTEVVRNVIHSEA